MSPSRALKDDGEPKTPNSVTTRGGSTSSDSLNDIHLRLGSVQQSITYIEAQLADTRNDIRAASEKITALNLEVASAKATVAAYKPLVKGIGRALWAIAGGVSLFLLTMLGYLIKHHYNI